ncbi:type I-F CRISPR-associated protein Csy1 [Psychrobacter lutiphocae]|uniref:type I-F CRISPR-associated protein Csy1 n=1 Tax=Psychrobacter lutiphocae TaxID=540500 RepID=UPI00036DBABF|nr:type I-F CRISPR-associated protein Csy1 [Psychrobacter lutiphocae]
MSSEAKKSWRDVITQYIDDLGEQNKIDKMKGAIIATALFNHLVTAKADDTKQNKALQKELNRLNKMSLNERSLPKIEKMYQDFIDNEWITSIDDTLNKLRSMTDYHHIWLRYALLQIDYVTPATHVAKLTHSSSGGSSIMDEVDDVKAEYLTTSSLNNITYDGAYPNASLSKIAKFLLLTIDDKPLGKLLKASNSVPFQNILKEDELNELITGFKNKLNPKPKADSLAKQVYYPVDDDYHLLVVLKPSSLIQAIYDNYFFKDIRKERDKVYKQKEKGKYSADILQSLPNIVTLSTVMSQPQNVSVNNGSRGGNIRLFNSAPPVWQSQLNPPIKLKSMFNARLLNRYAWDNIVALRKMLMTFENADISFKDPNRLKGISNWVKAIAHNVIDYSQTLAILPAGWTNDSECNLPIAQQIFLDFDRKDDEFVKLKQQSDWQGQLVKDFVVWLNKALKGKNNEFIASSEHSRVWRDIFANILREHMEVINEDSGDWKNVQNNDSSMQQEATV